VVELASSLPAAPGVVEDGILYSCRFKNNRKFALPVVISHRQDIYWHHWQTMVRGKKAD